MKQELIDNIVQRWKVTEAFSNGIAKQEDKSLWATVCNKSWFRTSVSFFTSVEKTHIGMLNDVNYFTDNCSVDGMMSYIDFYQNQTGKRWKELYQSAINMHKDRGVVESEYDDNNWWEPHIKCFSRGN